MNSPTTRKPYTSDLTDKQWAIIEPMIPGYTTGRVRETNMREVLNAIFYVLVNGCTWKNLPHDFSAKGTVRGYYHIWRRLCLWDKIHDSLRERVRVQAGREPTPSAGSIDSQSLKSARTAEIRGFIGCSKKIWRLFSQLRKSRKRSLTTRIWRGNSVFKIASFLFKT